MKSWYYIYVLLLLIFACSSPQETKPDDLIEPNTFSKIVLDIQLLEGMKTQRILDVDNSSWADSVAYDQILEKHSVDRNEFLKTYSYYQSNPGEMALIYEVILDSLSTIDAQVKKEYTREKKSESDSLLKAREQIRDSISKKILSK